MRVKDVARVDLGAKDYTVISRLDGKPAINIGIFQAPGSNALDISKRVRAEMERLKQRFPPGVDYRIIYDTTMFVKEAILLCDGDDHRGFPACCDRGARLSCKAGGRRSFRSWLCPFR